MKTKLALCALAVCLVPTITSGQQVSVNYNHNQSFTQYHTYAWGSNNANQVQNSILAQVAIQDINMALQGKGLKMVQENQNPDLLVTANGGMKEQTSYSAWGMRGFGGGMGGLTPEQNAVLRRAAEARGESANDYVLRHAVEAAEMELADRRVFVVDDGAWTELQELLSKPPALPPAMITLLTTPSVLERTS